MEEVALEGWLGLGFVGGREYEPLLCATVYLLHATHVVVLLLPRIASLIPPFSQRRKAKLRELVSYPEIHDGRSETQPRAVRLPGPHFCPLRDATSVPNKQVPGRGPWSKDAASGKDNACAEKVWRAC